MSLFVGLSNYWGRPTILVLVLAISRKGPLKCLLGGPRSRGSRFLGPSYRRRRPRRPISLDFSGLGWSYIESQHDITSKNDDTRSWHRDLRGGAPIDNVARKRFTGEILDVWGIGLWISWEGPAL